MSDWEHVLDTLVRERGPAAALWTLRPRLRACVPRFYDDLTVPEIARQLGLSDGTVKRYLSDAIGALEGALGPLPDAHTEDVTLIQTGSRRWSSPAVAADGSGIVDADVPLGPFVGRNLPAYVRLPSEPDPLRSVGADGSSTTASYPDGRTRSVVIARGDTVVAVLPASKDLQLIWVDQQAGSAIPVGNGSAPNLVTCATRGSAGGDALPAGSYTAYPVVEYSDSSVPGGSLASGWVVTVAVDGTDGFTRAVDALRGFSPTWQTISVPASTGDTAAATVGRWGVAVHAGLTDDGQPTVMYRLTPR